MGGYGLMAKFRDEVWSEHFGTHWIKGEGMGSSR